MEHLIDGSHVTFYTSGIYPTVDHDGNVHSVWIVSHPLNHRCTTWTFDHVVTRATSDDLGRLLTTPDHHRRAIWDRIDDIVVASVLRHNLGSLSLQRLPEL